MIKRLAHVCLGATDLNEAEVFYVDKLGMEKAFEFFRAGKRIGFYVKAGATAFIEIFADNGATNDERPKIRHFCLEVEDLDAVITNLAERGVEVSAKKLGADNAWQALDKRPERRPH